jgi:hypothetical protein
VDPNFGARSKSGRGYRAGAWQSVLSEHVEIHVHECTHFLYAGVAPVSGARSKSGRGYRAGAWMLLPTTRVLTPDLAEGGVAASVHVTLEVRVFVDVYDWVLLRL